ncbi:MAG: DUF6525 family protein [Pseudomonadota bacterium]
MVTGNRGWTSLRRRKRAGDTMREFDDLPPELRGWLSRAALPWDPRSVRRAYRKAFRKTGTQQKALAALDALEAQRLSKDTGAVFGPAHPGARI